MIRHARGVPLVQMNRSVVRKIFLVDYERFQVLPAFATRLIHDTLR
jgi:hypothetical protein